MLQPDSSFLVNKKKIVNDPVYGFINFPASKVFDIVEHPWFQRLRRIKQLGLTDMVYPGARHTRFHHVLGAMHLMSLALDVLAVKGHQITKKEAEAAFLAILLHDIGHGPFSHALEKQLIKINHEDLGLHIMQQLNLDFEGKLDLAIEIFTNNYPKKFLHQLVSSQLDVDRLDYLRRDSFFTGVSEGIVSSDRIIKMLDVVDDKIVVEKKGIYSIEKFLIARRLMYWQVYLHKTVHAAEQLVLNILRRARYLAGKGEKLFATPAFSYFLYNDISKADLSLRSNEILTYFTQLDDNDLTCSFKVWANHNDRVLSALCKRFVERRLYKNLIQDQPFDPAIIEQAKQKVARLYNIPFADTRYFVISERIENSAYKQETDKIFIKAKDGTLEEIVNVADMLNIKALSGTVSKYFLCYPKEISL